MEKQSKAMALLKTIDAILRVYFTVEIFAILIMNPPVVFPSFPFPELISDLQAWYIRVFGDHLAAEKPYFLRGLLADNIFVTVPLCIANVYAITTKKSWFSTTCLIVGVTVQTTLVAYVSELAGQQKAPTRLYILFIPFVGFALLAIFRGVVPVLMKSTSDSSTNSAIKKRA